MPHRQVVLRSDELSESFKLSESWVPAQRITDSFRTTTSFPKVGFPAPHRQFVLRNANFRKVFLTFRKFDSAFCIASSFFAAMNFPKVSNFWKVGYPSYRSVAATSRKLAKPASRFSIISSASTSGSGRLSRSAKDWSLSQVMSRLVLSRAMISS